MQSYVVNLQLSPIHVVLMASISLLPLSFLHFFYFSKFCHNAVAAAVFVLETEDAATLLRLLAILTDVITHISNGTTVEDAPEAILSHHHMGRFKDLDLSVAESDRINLEWFL